MFAFRPEDYPEGAVLRDASPIRLFRSDFLESFTHVRPIQLVTVIGPLVLLLSARGLAGWTRPLAQFPLYFLAGLLLVWTFLEYFLHRFLFHCRPRNRAQAYLLFLVHGIHHVQPQVRTRLLMPPVLSLLLTAGFLKLFQLVLGDVWMPVGAGCLLGYLGYDLLHYTLHFGELRHPLLRRLRRNHMRHHYVEPERLFGVTSPVWDWLLRTS